MPLLHDYSRNAKAVPSVAEEGSPQHGGSDGPMLAPQPQATALKQTGKFAATQTNGLKTASKQAPPAPSAGLRDTDFGQLSVKGGRGFKFSLKSFTWGDTAVKHVSLDPEAPVLEPKLPWQGRPWYTNVRIMAVPVVLAYIIICIVYIVIRATKSIKHISAPAYGIVVLVMEALGMVSLLQAGINHLYKVDWTTAPFMAKGAAKYRVRVLVPCYKEDVGVLRQTLLRAIKALHVAGNEVAEAHVYLCDDAPKDGCPKGSSVTFREERLAMMGIAAGGDAAPQSLRALARGEPSSPLHRKVTLHHQPRFKGPGSSAEGLVNNKAKNINHCVERIAAEWQAKTGRAFDDDGLEIFAILDADQAITDTNDPEDKAILEEVVEPPLRPGKSLSFFADLLPYFQPDPKVAIVQTPQVFKGCVLGTDILNHRNIDFWSHQQPAYNLRKFISCAGTNFMIRASAFRTVDGFPTHTLTEDFALGQELMRAGYYGVYVERAYVLGDAPDVLRTAVGQRSRWCKGAFQMLWSVRGLTSLFGLGSIRLIWLYVFPCYNYTVSGLSTPVFMSIPIVYIWAGAFPALLTKSVIGVAVAYFIITLMVQYFPRFDRGRVLPDMLAHWNADVATKNFWFMFLKAALRGPLPKCNEGVSKWKSGSDKDKDGWRDVVPHILFLIAYVVTIIWAILQIVAGVVFKGPLGISILWSLYQMIPPFLLVLHRCMKIRHEVQVKEGASEHERRVARSRWVFQHRVYTFINITCMLGSAALAIAILVTAVTTAGDIMANGGPYSGKNSTGYMTPAELVRTLQNSNNKPARFKNTAAA